MNYKELSVQNYKRFCEFEGSDYIASEFAIESILKIIQKFDVKNILELGLGIGSISDSVLKYSKNENKKIEYFGTEQNDFCLNSLKKNVAYYEKLKIYSDLNKIENLKFDLIIIDGYDKNLNSIKNYCKKQTIIFIEGARKNQTEAILKIFPKSRYVNIITLKKNKPYAHGGSNTNHYIGGGQLIFIEPSFRMILFWFNQKVLTFIKNKIRIYKIK
ncbi:hypothetical protein [Lutibacter sp. B1]|uniref:hypothetical protein n=1 Tax=Lutibacter sp. B1 TaxID=2725996 RepID=UPI0014569C39|nr:hypothetical protein [Lutibacter sp. B1]NLP58157.1 hypothetical protein [Lutibacter sp. B1]